MIKGHTPEYALCSLSPLWADSFSLQELPYLGVLGLSNLRPRYVSDRWTPLVNQSLRYTGNLDQRYVGFSIKQRQITNLSTK